MYFIDDKHCDYQLFSKNLFKISTLDISTLYDTYYLEAGAKTKISGVEKMLFENDAGEILMQDEMDAMSPWELDEFRIHFYEKRNGYIDIFTKYP